MKKRRFMKLLMAWLLVILLATQTFTVVAFPNGYELPENGSTVTDVGEEYYIYPGYEADEYVEEEVYEEYYYDYTHLIAAFSDGQLVDSREFPVSNNLEFVYVSAYDGDYSCRLWEPEYCVRTIEAQAWVSARARILPHERMQLFGATRSTGTPGVATVGNMSIASVEVLIGGSYQARYRNQVGHSHTVAQGASGNYYTTAIAASLMDPRLFTIHTQLDAAVMGELTTFLDRVSFTYGDLPFNDWIGGNNTFSNVNAPRLLELVGQRLYYSGGGTFRLETRVQFNSPYAGAGANLPINQPFVGYRGVNQAGFPLAMRHVVGLFDFDVFVEPPAGGAPQLVGSMPIRLNLYDNFVLWYQVEEWAIALREQSNAAGNVLNDRFVQVNVIGYSQQGRPIYNIVVASSQAAVDRYFNVTRPLKMTDPMELRQRIENGERHHLPIYFHNIHPDEVSGICSQLAMVEQLIWNDYLIYETVDVNDTYEFIDPVTWAALTDTNNTNFIRRTTTDTTSMSISVDEALDYFIFVFTPTNNPDGHYMARRVNAYGFDLNRDAAFQTQPENIYVMQNVIKWAPAILLEFHGHVAALLIEPCSPPHNPNYEYDLMQPFMLRLAHEMGRAAISGAYNRYMIPAVHRTRGWDDASVVYFPMYAALFGVLGYVLEIPHTNQDSFYANIAMGWAAIPYSKQHFNEIFFNKLEQHYRGITNYDARDLVDPFFVNPWHVPNIAPYNVIGRPRIPLGGDQYKDFFPDFWVIPIDNENQRNRMEAYRMIERLLRQEAQIDVLTAAVTHDGVTYPAGTFIIDMRQVFRGMINAIMSTPADISMFAALFAEQTIDFPNQRGFNADSIWSPGLFDGHTQPLTNFSMPASQLPAGTDPYVVIHNNNSDAIRIVNDLLRAGADVFMLASFIEGSNLGDFVTARSNLTPSVLDGRYVEMRSLARVPAGAEGPLVQPRVALLHGGMGAGQGIHATGRYIMRSLGFDYVWAQSNAELGALDRASFNVMFTHSVNWANMLAIANDGVPIVAVQAAAAAGVDTLFATPVVANSLTASREGIFRGSYSAFNILTGNYVTHDTMYIIGGRTYAVIPESAVPLMRTASGTWDDVFLGGFFHDPNIAGGNQANSIDRILAYTGITAAGVPATVFGPNIFNRAHTRSFDNIFASAIFAHVADINVTNPIPSFNIFNNGQGGTASTPNESLAAAGIIRMWTQLDGVNAPFAYESTVTITAYDQDNNCAMEFIRVGRRWQDGTGWLDDFNLIDVNKNGQWQYINFTITVFANRTVEVLLVNDLFAPPPVPSFNIFNNGEGGTVSTPNASLAAAGIIRMWTQLDGNGAPFAYATAATITAYDQDDNCAMEFIRVGRRWQDGTGWLDDFNLIDVNKNGQWQYINFTITVFGQTVEVLLANDLFVPPPVPGFNIFNNGPGGTVSTPNASLAAAGIIRMWTQLDGIGAPFAYADAATIAAYDQDDNCAMAFVRVNRRWVAGTGWADDFASVDIIRNTQWQSINFAITVYGQTVEILLVND